MERVPLNKLPSNSRHHVAQVQVVKLFAAAQNEGKARFQKITLKDGEGNKVRLTLFGDNIDIYSSILHEDAIYDVSNVTMKHGSSDYGCENELLMYVHNSSSIVPSSNTESSSSFLPNYITIATAAAINSSDTTFDLAGVVVRVGALELKHTRSGRMIDMSKIYLTDESCDDVVPIVLWGSLAHEGCTFVGQSGGKGVIAFHGLRKSFFRGEYSFTGGYDCRVCLNPHGCRIEALETWLSINAEKVIARQRASVCLDSSRPTLQTRTISSLTVLKADAVDFNGLYKIEAKIAAVDSQSVRIAFGCSHCGRGCEYMAGDKYVCASCKKPVVSIAKLYLDFEASDASASLALCAQTRAAETILGVRAHEFSKKTTMERADFVTSVREALLTRLFPIVLSPVPSLLRDHGIVKWALKYVEPPSDAAESERGDCTIQNA